ncbi:hypothetical protein [Bradyrhizobium sp. CER78]|uniref:hypothetical protein n=1 Tax=Bradyrhizobium sp. CER78 TaxID=3039162 RepID=UPI00244A1F21|nr:hypothetical protein [Bradyrhizobium sp. CER78]MDH2386972.1 hypothetical protein [Bradyrhizobium sp. CER78]
MQANVSDVWLDGMSDAEFSISLDLVARCIRSGDRVMQDYLVKDGRQCTRFSGAWICLRVSSGQLCHDRVSGGVPVLAIP